MQYWGAAIGVAALGFAFYGWALHESLAWGFGILGIASLAFGYRAGQIVEEAQRRCDDATQRSRSLQDRINSQAHVVDALADGLEVAIFVIDARANVLYANVAAEELFRFDSPVGRSVLAVTINYDLERLAIEALSKGERITGELQMSYPEERVVTAAAWPEKVVGNAFLAVYDTTSLRRLERIRTDFVANVSHELRTPLAIIRSMTETLQDDPKNVDLAKRYLPNILTEVDRLSSITEDLLILSVAESIQARRQACDLSEVVRSVCAQLEPKARAKGIALNVAAAERLVVAANYNQLNQVAINLIDNAINYTNEGDVSVRLSQEGDQAVLEVEDTGIGIPSDQVDRVFERFYRVDRGRSRATGGTGLGLSIVKNIVEAHGGTIRVESVQGKGTLMRAQIPIGDANAEPEPAQ